MNVSQSAYNIGLGLKASFLAAGGVAPYVYSVEAGGAGGTIDPTSGWYTAPASNAGKDVILAVDADGTEATATIFVSSVYQLVCDIIRREMELDQAQVNLYNQKFFIPENYDLSIAVVVGPSVGVGRSNYLDALGNEVQSVNMRGMLTINIMSRSLAALLRKEEILLALGSQYSQFQQAANGFGVSPMSTNFNDISQIDGAAIPYRFAIDVSLFYAVIKTKGAPYFNKFSVETKEEP